MPVGAAVSDQSGDVIYEGRSRMYERTAPPGELANSLLAHAEINALARLDPERRHEELRITTTLEPCPLCLGAIGMATVGSLTYLGRDPYGGAVGLLMPTEHLRRVPLRIDGPRDDPIGLLASAMHVAFYLERKPDGYVVGTHRDRAPRILSAAERLASSGAATAARRGESFEDRLPAMLAELADL